MVIVSNKPGQLGNRLFVFSSWIAYAMDNEETILNPSFDEYAEFFKGTYNQKISQFPNSIQSKKPILKTKIIYSLCFYFTRLLHKLKLRTKLFSYIYLDWEDSFDIEQLGKLNTKYLFVQGWLFRAKNRLPYYKKNILDYFSIIDPYHTNVDTFIKKLRNKHGKIIGIHIRLGDYATFEGGKYFYSMEVYKSQIENLYAQLKDQNPIFVICSNTSIDIAIFGSLPCMLGPGHFVEDLYVFSKCDYILGPPSTYTMWASFYGNVPLKSILTTDDYPKLSDFIKYN